MTAFLMRRPVLLLRSVFARRDRPALERLERIDAAEEFVWAILPHAARTFSACIAILPKRSALPAAVAYLYCRMLDTYEDLVPNPAARDAALRDFAKRLSAPVGGPMAPAPPIAESTDRDDRDRAHLLLVRRAHLVDAVYRTFDDATRAVVRDLVRDMSEGMRWSSRIFEAQGGVLVSEEQLAQYCRHVLGNPVIFGVRLLRLERGVPAELTDAEREDALRVGELVQLANVTRDIEKDLRRGVAYDAALRGDLGRDANGDRALAARCRDVRERLLRMALQRAPSYARIIEAIEIRGWSFARASGVLMLLFTERYYRGCARRAGVAGWPGPSSTATLLARTIGSAFSRRRAFREIARVEREFLRAAAR